MRICFAKLRAREIRLRLKLGGTQGDGMGLEFACPYLIR
jgi:hypothetical protein